MEVKVGIQHVQREVALETKSTATAVEEALGEALKDGGVFTLTDDKGRKVLIPAAQIAYVDLGTEHARPVGFGAVSA
ncbi:MAG: DUF3107 domain-containing protein [Propionibacteriaceae bacterium]|nr:DUF3107 domain-containing protein [Propionibacteriaceae bacterium]